MIIGLIVEGHGEVKAVPVLVRRILHELLQHYDSTLLPPLRVPRGRLVKELLFKDAVRKMARRAEALLVILDADDDCPAMLGPQLLAWAHQERGDRIHSVVIAKREYEAWFLAASASLLNRRNLSEVFQGDPETKRDAKGWLSHRMQPHGYSETIDQEQFSGVMSLAQARQAPSFEKLCRDIANMVNATLPPLPEEQCI